MFYSLVSFIEYYEFVSHKENISSNFHERHCWVETKLLNRK